MLSRLNRIGGGWWLVGIFLVVALGLRLFRLEELLGFYFDQGRDALVVRDFIIHHKLFLIGPTTGIEGIFLGPLYYLTLVPWYWLGKGNPVIPAIYVAATTVLALVVMARLAMGVFGKGTAAVFVILGAFSYLLIVYSRWLANPTQLMLASALVLWSLWKITGGEVKYWVLASFGLAAGLQFEAAGAFFFLPAVVIFLIWKRSLAPKGWVLVAALGVFLVMLIPQVWFDFRHDHLILKSFVRFLVGEGSFRTSLMNVVGARAIFYWQSLWSKVFASEVPVADVMIWLIVGSLPFMYKRLRSDGAKLLLIWLLTPLAGLMLYQGNHGYVWDYYLTGVYLVFVLLVAAVVSSWTRSLVGRVCFIAFMAVFMWVNLPSIRSYLAAGTGGPTDVALGNERQAVVWVLDKAKEEGVPYNIDIYVPPVVPYSYDYLFRWLGDSYPIQPSSALVARLYTIYEVDSPHPERLTSWLDRQAKISRVKEAIAFGGITVEERERVQ